MPLNRGFSARLNSQTWVATEGQTIFTIDNGKYIPNKNLIEVFIDGIHQDSGVSYQEINSTSFMLSEGLPAGTPVEAKWYENTLPSISIGHGQTHKLGGQDELKISDLAGYNNLNTDLSFKADKNYVDTKVTTISSGSPKGVYNTLADLQTAFPLGTQGIYVVLADGKWYYWSGSVWSVGGTYQSTAISDGSISKNSLDVGLQNKILSFNQLANNVYLHNGLLTQPTIVNSNTAEYTTNSTYGHFGFYTPNTLGNKYRVVSVVTNIGTVDATNVRVVVAYGNNPNGVSGGVGKNGVTVPNTTNTVAVGASMTFNVEIESVESAYAQIIGGIMTATSGVKFRVTQYIYNVTSFSDQVKAQIDWTSNLQKYMLVSEFASKAFSTDRAAKADWADAGNFAAPINKYQNLSGDSYSLTNDRLFPNGVVATDYSNGIYSGTPSVTNGELLVWVPNTSGKIAQNKKVMVTANVKADSATTVNARLFQYNAAGTVVGNTQSPNFNANTSWSRVYLVTTLDKADVSKLLVGIKCSGAITKFYFKDLMVVDVTDYDLDYTKIDTYGVHWVNYPVFVANSEKAIIADTATKALNADTATVASYANDGPFARLISKYENISGDPNLLTSARVSGNGTDLLVISNGVMSATPTATWGQILVTTTNKVSMGRKVLVTFNAKADTEGRIYPVCIQYQNSTQLGTTAGTGIVLNNQWTRVSLVVNLDKTGVNRLLAGPTNNFGTNYVKMYMKDFMVIDITDYDLTGSDVDALGGTWAQYPNIVATAESAKNAATATLATNATTATRALTADYATDGNFVKLYQQYENINGDPALITQAKLWGNGAETPVISNGIISTTPTATWGQLLISVTNKVSLGKKLLITYNAKTDTAGNIYTTCFQYQDNTQLGNTAGMAAALTTDWKRVYQIVTLDKTGVNKIWVGPTNNNGSNFFKIYVKDFMVIDITNKDLNPGDIDSLGGVWSSYPNIAPVALTAINSDATSRWKDKKILAIGDSLTAALKWQNTVASTHKCTVTTHAKGGIGIIAMVDGDGAQTNPIAALSVAQVADKDCIIFFGGMNERSRPYGTQGDLYPAQNTIYGITQYAINKIYNLLVQANNLKCKILFVTPHCAGKYNYIDADGYQEYPAGTGQTLEKLSNTLKAIAQYNNCQVVDLWHDSGIGRFTWSIYGASPTALVDTPSVGTPYPYNGDQLHLSDLGYARIGEVIAAKMNLL